MKSTPAVLVALPLMLLTATLAPADTRPWCPAVPDAPYPAPTWEEVGDVPNYQAVSENLNLTESLRLLISVLEKALARLDDGSSLAGVEDIDGQCVCDCGRAVDELRRRLGDAVAEDLPAALRETRDVYLKGLRDAFLEAKTTVVDGASGFRQEVEKILQDACNDPKVDVEPKICADPSQAGPLFQDEIDQVFDGRISRFRDLFETGSQLADDLSSLLSRVDDQIRELESGELETVTALQELPDLIQEIREVIRRSRGLVSDLEAEAESLRNAFGSGDLSSWVTDVLDGLHAQLDGVMQDETTFLDSVHKDLEAALDKRIEAVRDAAQELYDTAVDYESSFDVFRQTVLDRLAGRLGSIEGCYGVTKRSQCTADGFCDGREKVVWFPTEVFQDGKKAALFALDLVGWLDEAKAALQKAEAPKALAGEKGKKLVELLKDGEEMVKAFEDYVDHFSDGYHLGAYSQIRPDLHMCVGYAGHGALAQLFDAGKVKGGAGYLSANLSGRHRAQLRSGGFTLVVNGKKLPLAPGISLNLQMDGFRLWDRRSVFGLGPHDTGAGWSFDSSRVEEVDVFNLVDEEDLCALRDKEPPCTLTPSDFLYDPFYPIEYEVDGMPRGWPRPGAAWEEDHRLAAVFGAGLQLPFSSEHGPQRGQNFFEIDTQRWEGPSFLLFPGATLTLSLTLDAGFGWLYQSNYLRDTLVDRLNENAPGTFSDDDFTRLSQPFQAPDVTEDVGHAAFVQPTVEAALDLGLKLGKRLKVGVTASLHLGIDVEVGGYGGVLDLQRPFFDALAESNPEPGDDGELDCEPVIEENLETVCSNSVYREPEGCGGDEDCVLLEAGGSGKGGVFSTGEYACGEVAESRRVAQVTTCGEWGYCSDSDGRILAHDVTREECEDKPIEGLCCIEIPRNTGDRAFLANVDPSTCDLWPFDVRKYHPGRWLERCTYRTGNRLPNPSRCDVEDTVHCVVRSGRVPVEYTHHHFAAVPDGDTTFHPYQCLERRAPEVTGWTGDGCHPLLVGFDADQAKEIKAALEQPPTYTVASYALDRAVVSVLLGWSAKVGLEYKLFRKWKSKELWSDGDTEDLLSLPLVTFQMGLEAPYFDDCTVLPGAAGEVKNHQADLIPRDPGSGTAFDLVARCKPRMEDDVDAPQAPREDVGEWAAGAGEAVHGFGKGLATEYWHRSQLCIRGQRWDTFFDGLEESPETIWNLTRCGYRDGRRTLDLDCSGPRALERSLAEASGCLDLGRPFHRPLVAALGAGLPAWSRSYTPTVGGQPVGASRRVLDLGEIFSVDAVEDLWSRANVDPSILGLAGFDVDAWLAALDRCTADLDRNLVMEMDVGEVEPCGGACCEDGACRQVDHPSECDGSFSSGASCDEVPACPPTPSADPGICVTADGCSPVPHSALCRAGTFQAGTTCETTDLCFSDAACGEEQWCYTAEIPIFPDGETVQPRTPTAGTCRDRIPEGERCDGFDTSVLVPKCRKGLRCVSENRGFDFLGAFCRPACAPRPNRAVAWWPFDEVAGDETPDVLGSSPGRLLNGTRQIDGKVGRALAFDGADDRVEVDDATGVRFGRHDLSIAFWIRSRDRRANRKILHKRDGAEGWELLLHRQRPALLLADGALGAFPSGVPITDGNQHFVVVTVDRDQPDGVRWYLDGEAAGATGDPTARDGSIDAAVPLEIGGSARAGGHAALGLDELLLIRRALSAEEVLRLYRAGERGLCRCVPGAEEDAVAWWRFDSGPLRILDEIGDAHGTSSGRPLVTEGAVGRALAFDGEDDFVDVPHDPAFSFGRGDFSLEGWVRHLDGVNRNAGSLADQRVDEGRGFNLFVWRGRPGLQLQNRRYRNFVSQIDLTDAAWHHLAVTVDRDRPDGLRWYLDGREVGPRQNPTSFQGTLDSGGPLRFGAIATTPPRLFWKGELDELTFYDRVLAAEEVEAIAEAGEFGKCEAAR